MTTHFYDELPANILLRDLIQAYREEITERRSDIVTTDTPFSPRFALCLPKDNSMPLYMKDMKVGEIEYDGVHTQLQRTIEDLVDSQCPDRLAIVVDVRE